MEKIKEQIVKELGDYNDLEDARKKHSGKYFYWICQFVEAEAVYLQMVAAHKQAKAELAYKTRTKGEIPNSKKKLTDAAIKEIVEKDKELGNMYNRVIKAKKIMEIYKGAVFSFADRGRKLDTLKYSLIEDWDNKTEQLLEEENE